MPDNAITATARLTTTTLLKRPACASPPRPRGCNCVYHDLWYTAPPMKGGSRYGWLTMHWPAIPPDRVPRFHQLDFSCAPHVLAIDDL